MHALAVACVPVRTGCSIPAHIYAAPSRVPVRSLPPRPVLLVLTSFPRSAQADSVVKAFTSLGSLTHALEGDDIIEKCQRMCEEHDLSAIDLAYKWEAHVDKVSPLFRPVSMHARNSVLL